MDVIGKASSQRKKKYLIHAVFVYLLSFVMYGSVNGSNSGCQTFGSIFSSNHVSTQSHWCKKECLDIFNHEKIHGTRYYSQDSLICKAALHAGVLGPEGGRVDILRQSFNGIYEFVGTVRHRVVSYSERSQFNGYYYSFSNEQWIPYDLSTGTWMADVTMVHNSYNGNFSKRRVPLWITCLYEDTIAFPKFYSWSFYEIDDKFTVLTKKERHIEIRWKYDVNARIVQCLGKNHFMDVQGVLSRRSDEFLTSNLAYRGIRNRNLQIKFKKFEERKEIITERLPALTSKSPNFSKSTFLTDLNDSQSGYFIVREDNRETAAHFQVYVQDCPYDSYGAKCGNKCNCQNDGICHPTIGACICRPGFHGPECNDRCKVGAFGSKCQFKCTSSDLGESVNERGLASCVGLIFCLPEPFGCSCAFGYKGRFCDKYEHYPYLKKPFNVTFNEGKVTVTFDKWDPSLDGGLDYGLKIEGYYVEMNSILRNESREATSFGQKFNAIFEDIEGNVLYDVRIFIKVQDPAISYRQPRLINNDTRSIQFSTPCLIDSKISLNQTVNWIVIAFEVPSIGKSKLTCYLLGADQSRQMEVPIGQTLVQYKVDDLHSGKHYTFETWCENEFGKCKKRSFQATTLIDVHKFISFHNCTMTAVWSHFPNGTEYNITVLKIREVEKWNNFASNINDFGILNIQETSKLSFDSLIEHSSVEYIFNDWERMEIEDCATSEPYLIGIVLNYKLGDLHLTSVADFQSDGGSRFNMTATYVIATGAILILLIAIIIILKRRRDGKPITPSFGVLNNRLRRFSKSNQELVNESSRNSNPQQRNPVRLFNPQVVSNPQSPAYMNVGSKEFKFPENNDGGYINVNETTVRHIPALPEIEKKFNELIYSSKSLQQFQSVPLDCGKPMQIGKQPPNVMKNRYKNNLPYDDSRVVLSTLEGDPHSDYINASFIKGIHPNNWYIACQGPKDKNMPTIGDFWRMIIEMDVDTIVMIANFVEDAKVKVGRYFKKEEPLRIKDVTITVLDSIEFSHFCRSEIQVSSQYGTKCVVHYQFIKWPDHGIPTQVYPICSMLKAVLEEFMQGTMVIHCSAGIGRTGSVLFVILLKELLEQSSSLDPVFVLKHMRESRARLVENILQYNFSLEALHYLLFSEKGLIDTSKFEGNFDQLRDECCQLYDELVVQPIKLSFDIGQTSSTIALNRNRAVLPSDLHVVSGTSVLDYINAIYVDLEDVRKALIVTEHPLISTVYRFWQMIVKKGCSSLILINESKPSEKYPSLYSVGEFTATREDFFIDVQPAENEIYGGISCYSITISIGGASHFLEVYQVHNWPRNQEIPPDFSVLESISNIVLRTAQTKTPAVLCCSDGVTGCGLVASALNVISHLQLYQEINIYYMALKMRRYRPQFIKSQRQFLALYETAFSFLQNNSHYQNFQ